MLQIILGELERRQKDAALYYMRYGKGRSRFERLQKQRLQYLEAVRCDSKIGRDSEVDRVPVAA